MQETNGSDAQTLLIVEQKKTLAAKPEDLSSIPSTYGG